MALRMCAADRDTARVCGDWPRQVLSYRDNLKITNSVVPMPTKENAQHFRARFPLLLIANN
jgi:hypothetical protein